VVATELFKVATVFKFDAAQAIVESNALASSVDKISGAAEQAKASIQNLGISYLLSFSGAGGGILGLLGSALKSSDLFTKSQLSFTNIISANMSHLTGTIGTFTDQMLVAKKIQNDIIADARKWAIPATELLEFTKSLSAFLVPKGLAGENFKAARDFSRNLLKSAPILGINPQFAGQQAIRAVEGQAGIDNPVFRRLLNEAPEPFKAENVKTAKEFNVLPIAKRFDILNSAMNKFSSNMDVLNARANTLSGLFQRLKDLFYGFSSVLKPLGDVIIPPLVKVLNYAIKMIETKGAELVKIMARFIGPLVENPKKMMLGLMQASKLSEDIGKSAGYTALVVSLMHLKHAFAWFKGTNIGGGVVNAITLWSNKIPVLGWILNKFGGVFTWLTSKVSVFMSGGFFKVFGKLFGLFGVLTILFQAMSRAAAKVKINTLEAFLDKSTVFADSITRIKESLSRLMLPINTIIDGLADVMSLEIFGKGSFLISALSWALSGLADVLESVSMAVLEVWAAFRGLVAGLMALIIEIPTLMKQMFTPKMFTTDGIADLGATFGKILEFGMDEYKKTIKDNLYALDNNTEDKSVANNVTNIGKVEIRQDFKEQQEPDRIAFTVADHLKKLATNRRSSSGRSMSNGLRAGVGVQTI
jgi:hypothetical protein